MLAGDIRRGIERTVVHPDYAPFNYYSTAIVGAKACWDAAKKAIAAKKPRPDCHLRAGIAADDRTGTVTFHLTQAAPEFVDQLSLMDAAAVPQDTPVDLTPGAFLPATGPYKVLSYTPKRDATAGRPGRHGRLEFVRNPYFHVWSPAAQPDGYPDRIVLETGYSNEEAVARVTDGRDDLVWLVVPPADVNTLRSRYPSQLHTSAGSFVSYVFLDVTQPPFDNPDARRAVAFALDRGSLADLFSGSVSCQLIPPDFPAYKPYCPFTVGRRDSGRWSGVDLSTAQDFMTKSGTRSAKVVVTVYDDRLQREAGKRVVAMLNGLGYRASRRVVPYADFPGDHYNAGLVAWGADYPAASNYLVPLASCDRDLGFFNFAGSCDPKLDGQMTPVLERQAADPGRASDAWADIDRAVVDAAATIPFSVDFHQDFVSRRVGNTPVHPLYGPLIAQMWVQ